MVFTSAGGGFNRFGGLRGLGSTRLQITKLEFTAQGFRLGGGLGSNPVGYRRFGGRLRSRLGGSTGSHLSRLPRRYFRHTGSLCRRIRFSSRFIRHLGGGSISTGGVRGRSRFGSSVGTSIQKADDERRRKQ